jgi:hypothetical protein
MPIIAGVAPERHADGVVLFATPGPLNTTGSNELAADNDDRTRDVLRYSYRTVPLQLEPSFPICPKVDQKRVQADGKAVPRQELAVSELFDHGLTP